MDRERAARGVRCGLWAASLALLALAASFYVAILYIS
jgi:hypothetical protein